MIISAGTFELSRKFSEEASNSGAVTISSSVKVKILDIPKTSRELQERDERQR